MTFTDHDLGDLVLSAARGRHAFEDTVERLATAIRLGVYPYGVLLPPERELAARMGISRATLREAIAALRAAGMVRTTRGRRGGNVVDHAPTVPGEGTARTVTGDRSIMLDALVFRRVVEPGACHVAAQRRLSAAQRTLLSDALAGVDAAAEPAAHRQADSRLHLAIASVTDSPQLVEAVTAVQARLHDMLVAIPVLPVNIAHSNDQHAEIIAAVLAGRPDRARRAMESHCDDTAALLRGLFR